MIISKLPNFDPNRVVRNRLEACARREKLAMTLRDALAVRLGDSANDVIVSVLVDSCVSAHLEIVSVTAMYIEGHASQKALQRLARGQLVRTLDALGLTPKMDPGEGDASKAKPLGLTLDEVTQQIIRERRAPIEGEVSDEVGAAAS